MGNENSPGHSTIRTKRHRGKYDGDNLLACLKMRDYKTANVLVHLVQISSQSGLGKALDISIKKGLTNCVKTLLQMGVEVKNTEKAIRVARRTRNPDIVELLLEHEKVFGDLPAKLSRCDPFFQAVHKGDHNRVKELLENRPDDIFQVDPAGLNALHLAMNCCTCEELLILQENNNDGDHVCKHAKVAGELLSFLKRTRMSVFDYEARTCQTSPLLIDCLNMSSTCAMLRVLLEQDINRDESNEEGETALHIACRRCNLQAVKMLVTAGASLYIEDKHNYTPIHHAIRWNHSSILSYLLKRADLQVVYKLRVSHIEDIHEDLFDWTTEGGFTLFQMATLLHNVDALRVLLRYMPEGSADLLPFAEHWANDGETLVTWLQVLAQVVTEINTYKLTATGCTILNSAITHQLWMLVHAACQNPALDINLMHKQQSPLQMLIEAHTDKDPLDEFIIQFLKIGANPNVQVPDICSAYGVIPAITWTVINCKPNVVKTMLQSGSHPGSIIDASRRPSPQCAKDALSAAVQLDDDKDREEKIKLLVTAEYDEIDIPNFVEQAKRYANYNTMKNWLPYKVFTLEHLARKSIRNNLTTSKGIDKLPLPRRIKEYLYIPELYFTEAEEAETPASRFDVSGNN